MHRTLAILVTIGTLTLTGSADAAHPTLDEASSAAFDADDTAAGALAHLGASPTEMLVGERLPGGSWAVEWGWQEGARFGRLPMKFERRQGAWVATWHPTFGFGTALANISRSGALPKVKTKRPWDEVERLPSLPVIVTDKRYITPFGSIEPDEPTRSGLPGANTPTPAGPMKPSEELTRHTQRWIAEFLENDPAPASFDLLVDGSMSWGRFNAAVFSIAATGLYIGEVIVEHDGGLGALPFAAPTNVSTGGEPPQEIVAIDRREGAWTARVLVDGKPRAGDRSDCPEDDANSSVCADTPDALADRAIAVFGKERPDRLMLAAPPRMRTDVVIAFADRMIEGLELAPHRLFSGLVAP